MKLDRLITAVQKAYHDFEFRQAVHEIDYFCSVDMSATYLDILKDRLYTFPKNSQLRRGSQTVILDVIVALAKVMAPILSFTSEEIWRTFPDSIRKDPDTPSVHLSTFPQRDPCWKNAEIERDWSYLLPVRTVVQGALEKQRRDKVIGSSLEGTVVLHATSEKYAILKKYENDLAMLFIVSQVQVTQASVGSSEGHEAFDEELGIMVDVKKAESQKCERCWNYRTAVGTNVQHPTLCDRCIEAVE